MKFRMVDRILRYEPRRFIRGLKTVSFEEYSLRRDLLGPPGLPETLLLESLLQLGNWLIVLSSDFQRMGLLIRIERVEFIEPVRPGRRVLAEAVVRHYRDDGMLFDGQAFVDGRPVARGGGCLAVPAPLEDYCDAEDLRVLFSQIHRPGEAHADAETA